MYTWIRIEIGWQILNSQIIIYIAQYYKMVLIFNIIRVGTYQTFSFISFQPISTKSTSFYTQVTSKNRSSMMF